MTHSMLRSCMAVVRSTVSPVSPALLHLLGGVIGAFLTGLFSQRSVNPESSFDGAFYGRPIQLWYQTAGILTGIGECIVFICQRSEKYVMLIGIGFAAVCTAGILLPMKWMMNIRLAKEDEREGLDVIGECVCMEWWVLWRTIEPGRLFVAAHGQIWERAVSIAMNDTARNSLVDRFTKKESISGNDGHGVAHRNFDENRKPSTILESDVVEAPDTDLESAMVDEQEQKVYFAKVTRY